MEFVTYIPEEDAVIVKITMAELVDLGTVVNGVMGTFSSQDPTIFLGVNDKRLEELSNSLLALLHERAVVRRRP